MTCPTSMMLTAVARLTDAELAYGGMSGRVRRPASSSGLFTVDAEPGRRYPVFIVLVRY